MQNSLPARTHNNTEQVCIAPLPLGAIRVCRPCGDVFFQAWHVDGTAPETHSVALCPVPFVTNSRMV